MPRYKLSDKDRKRIVELKRLSPCLTNAGLARVFDISPSRVSEIIRDVKRDRSK